MKGIIFDIKEMAVHDGPGIRTTVFFKGCPLHCAWCHNPEGIKKEVQLMYKKARCKSCGLCTSPCNHEICRSLGRCIYTCPENALKLSGTYYDSKNLSRELIKSAEIMGDNFGGFTFSGGEPLAQPEFLNELKANLSDYHLAIETSGYAKKEVFRDAVKGVNLVIMDIKLADSDLHKKYTGVHNKLILENFSFLKENNIPHIIRTPLISGITDTDKNLSAIESIVGDSSWEKLPENTLAGTKYEMLGMDFPLGKIRKEL